MSYESTVLADSPTFLWLLDETTGSVAADATGNGNAGGYTQGAAGPPGVSANAVQLNGSTGFIYTNSNLWTSSFSAEEWFKSSSADGGTLAAGNAWIAILGDDGLITFSVYNGSALISCESTAGYSDGDWHYIAVTYENEGDLVLYVDGRAVASAANPGGVDNLPGNPAYSLGYGAQSVSTSPFVAGGFSAFADYPHALTSEQVAAHFSAAGGTPPSGSAFPSESRRVTWLQRRRRPRQGPR